MNPEIVYQTLRQELLEAYTRQVNLVSFAFTASVALIGYSLVASTPNPLVFLLPLLILALLLVQLNNTGYTIFTISVYIRVFIERRYNIPPWETQISTLRSVLRKTRPFDPLRPYSPVTLYDTVLYAVAATVMGGICIGLSYFNSGQLPEQLITVAVAAVWVAICVFAFRPLLYVNSGKYEEDLEKEWTALKTHRSAEGRTIA